MVKNELRLSQLIRTFGPGAMVDMPSQSVVIGGLEQWTIPPGVFETLSEPRLQARLEAYLHDSGRLDRAVRLALRTPPIRAGGRHDDDGGVAAPTFPTWFVCKDAEIDGERKPGAPRRRRLVRWNDLDPSTHKKFEFDGKRKSEVTPIRFVSACDNGHLQDIDWIWTVHGGPGCGREMWLEEKGANASPADIAVACACGKRITLEEAFQPGRLGKCRGERPWLLDRDPLGCDKLLKPLPRTATNTYFSQVYTVISLPTADDDLSKLVAELAGEMTIVQSVEQVAVSKQYNGKIGAILQPYDDESIFACLVRLREDADAGAKGSAKLAEFDLFASGRAEIGQDHAKSKLYAQTLPRDLWEGEVGGDAQTTGVRALVAVHRLREVSALYGFTRFEPAPNAVDDGLEDKQLAVRGAPISKGANWLPAVEQFGEGLFVHIDPTAMADWLAREPVARRHDKLVAGHGHWQKRFRENPPVFPGTSYVFLHSLSHALMSEISIDCGYPASALKERIYAFTESLGEKDRFGILIYTASPGAQGTLGGLVAAAPRFARILRSALDRLAICSNDPVCADHLPDDRSGDRATHGAACHGCLLISETSCEARNQSLDRALLVDTMAQSGAAFFS